jgi:hypothetical protein
MESGNSAGTREHLLTASLSLSQSFVYQSYLVAVASCLSFYKGFHPGNCDGCLPNRSRLRSRRACSSRWVTAEHNSSMPCDFSPNRDAT